MTRIEINLSGNPSYGWDDPDALSDLADAFAISSPEQEADDEAARAAAAVDVTPPEDPQEATTRAPVETGLSEALDPQDVRPVDPSEIGYPPTLPIEVALQTAPDDAIREAYGFTEHQWAALKRSSPFKRDLEAAQDMLRTEGMSFKAKARLQSEELLTTSWGLIHDPKIPATVRADLIKFTIRAAGLEAKAADKGDESRPALSISINM